MSLSSRRCLCFVLVVIIFLLEELHELFDTSCLLVSLILGIDLW